MAIDSADKRRVALNFIQACGIYSVANLPLDSLTERYSLAGYYDLAATEEEDEILADSEAILGVVHLIHQKVGRIELDMKKQADDHWQFLYSAIRDIRREILRGKGRQ